jgi:hypothetical protein
MIVFQLKVVSECACRFFMWNACKMDTAKGKSIVKILLKAGTRLDTNRRFLTHSTR